MENEEEYIRRLAHSMQHTEAVAISNVQSREKMLAREELERQRTIQEKAMQVQEICGRFSVWGARNRIPYNSHGLLASGWLLGHRSGSPGYSYSHEGVQASGSSDVSLLVNRSGLVRERVVRSVVKKSNRAHLVARKAELANFDLAPIYKSIAKFSARYGVEWTVD